MTLIKLVTRALHLKRIFLFFLLLLSANILLMGWSFNSTKPALTDFYYYKNQPYYLDIRTDKIFIKTKDVLTQTQFKSLLNRYYQTVSNGKFDVNEKMQFVDLAMLYDQSSIAALVNALNQDPQVEYSSPVYSPKDNSEVLQGALDQILVQFKPSINQNQIDAYLQSNNFDIVQSIDITGGKSYVLKIPRSSDIYTIDAANTVYNSGLVNWSEPDFYYYGLLLYIPNDTYFPMQWSLRNLGNNIPGSITGIAGCDMRVDSAWNLSLGNSHCVIGMVDTGIDTLHEDISANIIPGKGYDFINGHSGCMDDNNHGTCTAGIVAALGNNSLGISGVAPQCKLIGVKIFNSAGSTSSTAITNGLLYSWQQGEWVSSNSWGGGSPISAADQAIQDGTTSGRSGKGTVFCFASGNNNGALTWPSTNSYVIAVGGISPCNQRKSTSSCDLETWWGADYGTGLHIVAPCVKVYATDRMGSVGYSSGNYYDQFNGTSSATPNCAGVCALVMSLDSTLRWDSVRVKICRTADKVGSYTYGSTGPITSLGSTWNNEMGYGKINAYKLLSSLGPPPPTPVHDIVTGPFLSLPSQIIINTANAIKTKITNSGTSNETNVPIRFFINGTLISTTNKNLTSNQVDSVSNTWTPSAIGSYTLTYASGLSNDTNRTNDTVRTTVQVMPGPLVTLFCDDFTAGAGNWTITNNGGICLWSVRALSSRPYTMPSTATGNVFSADADACGSGTTINSIATKNTSVNCTNIAGTYAEFDNDFYLLGSDQCKLDVSTDGGTTWINKFTWTANRRNTHEVQALPEADGKANVKIRLISIQPGWDWWWAVDNVCIKGYGYVGVSNNQNNIPKEFALTQNYPNPFNPTTVISYALPKSSSVKLVVYDMLGREIKTLVNEFKQAGSYDVSFDASSLASGVYFYRINAGDFTDAKKMMLIK
jgi:subtilisin family serine protease